MLRSAQENHEGGGDSKMRQNMGESCIMPSSKNEFSTSFPFSLLLLSMYSEGENLRDLKVTFSQASGRELIANSCSFFQSTFSISMTKPPVQVLTWKIPGILGRGSTLCCLSALALGMCVACPCCLILSNTRRGKKKPSLLVTTGGKTTNQTHKSTLLRSLIETL